MSVAFDAKRLYVDVLRTKLEPEHHGEYVAIEPTSGEWFIAQSALEASLAAKRRHPDRTSFLIRIGFDAAFHLGAAHR